MPSPHHEQPHEQGHEHSDHRNPYADNPAFRELHDSLLAKLNSGEFRDNPEALIRQIKQYYGGPVAELLGSMIRQKTEHYRAEELMHWNHLSNVAVSKIRNILIYDLDACERRYRKTYDHLQKRLPELSNWRKWGPRGEDRNVWWQDPFRAVKLFFQDRKTYRVAKKSARLSRNWMSELPSRKAEVINKMNKLKENHLRKLYALFSESGDVRETSFEQFKTAVIKDKHTLDVLVKNVYSRAFKENDEHAIDLFKRLNEAIDEDYSEFEKADFDSPYIKKFSKLYRLRSGDQIFPL